MWAKYPEAKQIRFYAVLSDFANYRDLRVKVLRDSQKKGFPKSIYYSLQNRYVDVFTC